MPKKVEIEPVQGCAEELADLMRNAALEMVTIPPWRAVTADELLRRAAQGQQTVTVRDADGRLVGYTHFRVAGEYAHDNGMYLLPEARGSAELVNRMISAVVGGARELGARWMLWECEETSGSSALARRRRLRRVATIWAEKL